jgi:3',5'-cyclic AMP phosphodiesterase CpdA
MRNFTIAHISDIHLEGKNNQPINILKSALSVNLKNSAKPHILLVTGDVVDSPSPEALQEAKKFVEDLKTIFDYVYIIPGNHDVKSFLGSFSRSHEFNKVFNTKDDLLLRQLGLHLIGIDSTHASYARGNITQAEYDSLLKKYYDAESNTLPNEEVEGILRIVAVHHHPLPLAEGEDQKILHSIKDENLMYLESPAKFLEACFSYDVRLILHGHRHVQGITRYSIQSSKLITSNSFSENDSWENIYVLRCSIFQR